MSVIALEALAEVEAVLAAMRVTAWGFGSEDGAL
jgi:hypothetical protein